MANFIVINPELAKACFGVSALIGVLLISALLTRRVNRQANSILAAVLAISLINQGMGAVQALTGLERFSFLLRAALPLSLFAAALTYFYVLALTEQNFRFQKRHLVYLLPSFLALIWYFGFLLFVSDPAYWTRSVPLLWESYLRTAAKAATFGAFLFLSYKKLTEFQRSAGEYFSNLAVIHFRWLRFLLSVITCLWVVSLLDLLTGPLIPLWQISPQITSLGMFALALYALRLTPVFSPDPAGPSSGTGQKHSDAELARWSQKLLEYVAQNSPYLDPNIRLPELSRAIGLKPYMLSETLNRHMGVSFFNFINRYRVDEAKRRLKDPKYAYMNVMGIALESGFNSKSAFNETFRTIVGVTPSAYRAQPIAS